MDLNSQYAQMKRRICVIDPEPSSTAALDVSQDAASPPVTDTHLRVQIRGRGLRDQDRGPWAVHQGAGL